MQGPMFEEIKVFYQRIRKEGISWSEYIANKKYLRNKIDDIAENKSRLNKLLWSQNRITEQQYKAMETRIEISRKAQITLNKYIKNINNVSQSEIKRLVKNYNEMVNEGINIIYNYKKVLFSIGKKYNRALQIYNKNKNEYIYLGLISKGEHIEKRTDTKVLKALDNIFVGKVFNEYLK